jgi:hypothetical protein
MGRKRRRRLRQQTPSNPLDDLMHELMGEAKKALVGTVRRILRPPPVVPPMYQNPQPQQQTQLPAIKDAEVIAVRSDKS